MNDAILSALLGDRIFPDKAVNLGILWTATSTYMSLPQNLVIDALTAAIKLDGAETHT